MLGVDLYYLVSKKNGDKSKTSYKTLILDRPLKVATLGNSYDMVSVRTSNELPRLMSLLPGGLNYIISFATCSLVG